MPNLAKRYAAGARPTGRRNGVPTDYTDVQYGVVSMGFAEKSGYQRGSIRRVRTAIGVEPLERRAMLAGLINLPDGLLPTTTNPVTQVAAEMRCVDHQASAGEQLGIHKTTKAEIGGAAAEAFIWDPSCDWLSDTHRPTTEEGSSEEHSAKADDADSEDSSAKSDFIGGQNEGQPVESTAPQGATDAVAPPPIGPINQPDFVTIMVTPIQTPEIKRPLAAPSGFTTAATPAEPFHYFSTASKLNRGHEKSLSSEPLSTAAARETFVAFSLLDVSALRQSLPVQTAARTSSPPPHEGPRRELMVATSVVQEIILESDHSRKVNKALTAMELALAVVRDADATCAQIQLRKERNDQSERSLSPAVVLAQATLIPPSINATSVIAMWNNPLQVGLLCLVSMLLTVTTPLTTPGKTDATRLSLRSVFRNRQRLGNRS